MKTRSYLSSHLWLRRWSNFMLCINSERKDTLSVYVSHCSVLFLLGLKSKYCKIFCQTVLYYYSNTCCLFYQRASLLYNKEVRLASQKSKHDLTILSPCDNRYVGRTSQKLQNRIKLHVSKSNHFFSFQKRIRPACQYKSSTQSYTQSFPVSDSVIILYLLQNPVCSQYYDDSIFSILSQGRSSFHLFALEATFIKISVPALCRQK